MRIRILLAVTVVFTACVVFAQGPAGGPGHGGPGHGGPGGPGGFGGRGGGFGPGGLGFRPGRVITGAPYLADVTKSSVQTLSDGNSITHTTTSKVARDSVGRTYSQETFTGGILGANGPTTVTFVSDPVAGYSYVLNATTKVATRRAIKPHEPPPAGADATPRPPRTPGPNVVSTDLGTQVVNGVTAQGKKVTHTIPAGEFGNAAPIVSTSETWFSPDLHEMVASTRNDPRQGKMTYALTNIQRVAPPATLFQVPSDYTVQDAQQPHFGGGRRPGPPPAQ